MNETRHEGGCLCGAVRYAVSGERVALGGTRHWRRAARRRMRTPASG